MAHACVWTSPDGITWTAGVGPLSESDMALGASGLGVTWVDFHNAGSHIQEFVMGVSVGFPSSIGAYSTDGKSWSQASPASQNVLQIFATVPAGTSVGGGPGVVGAAILSGATDMLPSNNGINFTPSNSLGTGSLPESMTYFASHGLWIMGDSSGEGWHSNDGSTWTHYTIPGGGANVWEFNTSFPTAYVASGGSYAVVTGCPFVGGTNHGAVWYSTTAANATWTDTGYQLLNQNFIPLGMIYDSLLGFIGFGADSSVPGGQPTVFINNTVGDPTVGFTEHNVTAFASTTSVIGVAVSQSLGSGSGRMVAIGGSSVATSDNGGGTWTNRPIPAQIGAILKSIAWSPTLNLFVITGLSPSLGITGVGDTNGYKIITFPISSENSNVNQLSFLNAINNPSSALGLSPDGTRLYMNQTGSITYMNVSGGNYGTVGILTPGGWGTPQVFSIGMAVDPSNGDIYVADAFTGRIVKITAAGTVTSPWLDLSANLGGFWDIRWGRDGQLVCTGRYGHGGIGHVPTSGWWAFRVSTAGVVTNIPGADDPFNNGYPWCAADSKGNIWVTIYNRSGKTTRIRQWNSSNNTLTEYPVQDIQDLANDGAFGQLAYTEALGGIFLDSSDRVIIPMMRRSGTAPGFTNQLNDADAWRIKNNNGGWTFSSSNIANPGAWVSAGILGPFQPDAGYPTIINQTCDVPYNPGGFQSLTLTLETSSYPASAGQEWQVLLTGEPTSIAAPVGIPNGELIFANVGVSLLYQDIAGWHPVPGGELGGPALMPAGTTHAGIRIGVDNGGAFPFIGPGINYDMGYVSLSGISLGIATSPGLPDLAWFLLFDPKTGVSTRIGGTWSYTGMPPPKPSGTAIADGLLNISQACRIDMACGVDTGFTTLWWLDSSDFQANLNADIIRYMKLSAGTGWSIGQIRIG